MSTLYAPTMPTARQQAAQKRQSAGPTARSPQRQASGAVGYEPTAPSVKQNRQQTCQAQQQSRQPQSQQSQHQTQQLPDPGRWAGTVAVYAWEIMHGMRQPQHLARWLTPELYDALSRRAQVAVRCQAGKPARIPYLYAVRAQASASGWEVSVLLSHDGRIHACACQIQSRHGHWVMTYLHMG